jgi:hypothetical protein
MWIRKGFRWMWSQAMCLLIGGAKVAAWCVTIAATLSFGFVLAAQLTRLSQSGDWRAVSFSDFLQILRIDIAPTGGESMVTDVVGLLLNQSATLVLFVAAAAAFGIKKSLDVFAHSRSRTDQSDMISSIERALAKARKLEG